MERYSDDVIEGGGYSGDVIEGGGSIATRLPNLICQNPIPLHLKKSILGLCMRAA